MDIGTIKTITLNDDRLECAVDFGADDVDPLCIVNCGANRNEYPMPGDEVVVDRDGAESSIIAVFRPVSGIGEGESIFYGRDGSGNNVCSVLLKNNGDVAISGGPSITINSESSISIASSDVEIGESVSIGSGNDPVATSWVVDGFFSVIDAMLGLVDPLVGNVYTDFKKTEFPLTNGEIPSCSSENLLSDPTATKATP